MDLLSFDQEEINIKRYKMISKIGSNFVYEVENKESCESSTAKIFDCGNDEKRVNQIINDHEINKILRFFQN